MSKNGKRVNDIVCVGNVVVDADEAGTAARTKAPTVVRRELTTEVERFERPLAVDGECAPRLFSAIGAVATTDVQRLASDAVADRAAKASPGPYFMFAHLRTTVPGRTTFVTGC